VHKFKRIVELGNDLIGDDNVKLGNPFQVLLANSHLLLFGVKLI